MSNTDQMVDEILKRVLQKPITYRQPPRIKVKAKERNKLWRTVAV